MCETPAWVQNDVCTWTHCCFGVFLCFSVAIAVTGTHPSLPRWVTVLLDAQLSQWACV